jgi:predicted nucleic acid-binding protein
VVEKYFVDTLIWRDYYENREDRFRPIGEWAFRFFKMAMEEESLIFISDFVEDELKKDYEDKQFQDVLSVIDNLNLLKKVNVTRDQFTEAGKLRKDRNVPLGDALHAITARDIGAIIITRDHHFEKLQDIAPSRKPEELI